MPDKELARLKKLIELLDEVTADATRLRESVSQSLQQLRGRERLAEEGDVAIRREVGAGFNAQIRRHRGR